MQKPSGDEQTFETHDGREYSVPIYRPAVGQSANDLAKALGGYIPPRSERKEAGLMGRVFACVNDSGMTYPVAK